MKVLKADMVKIENLSWLFDYTHLIIGKEVTPFPLFFKKILKLQNVLEINFSWLQTIQVY